MRSKKPLHRGIKSPDVSVRIDLEGGFIRTKVRSEKNRTASPEERRGCYLEVLIGFGIPTRTVCDGIRDFCSCERVNEEYQRFVVHETWYRAVRLRRRNAQKGVPMGKDAPIVGRT